MKKQICFPRFITRNLLPSPQSRRGRWAAFLGRDWRLRSDAEEILKKRRKGDFRARWQNRDSVIGAFSLFFKLGVVIKSSNFYFFPEDDFFVIAKAYGVHPPELYEILHDSFFRKNPKYKTSLSELYLGVPEKISLMTLGDLLHHFNLLKAIRAIRDDFGASSNGRA